VSHPTSSPNTAATAIAVKGCREINSITSGTVTGSPEAAKTSGIPPGVAPLGRKV
jgi:hypothetical protein